MYIFQLMDFYSASGLSLLWICFFETVAISWFYGAGKFASNIESMIGYKPSKFWQLCWTLFAPGLMAGVFFYYLATYVPVKYGDYEYPMWAEILGLCISLSSMVCVPAYVVYYALSRPGTIIEVSNFAPRTMLYFLVLYASKKMLRVLFFEVLRTLEFSL